MSLCIKKKIKRYKIVLYACLKQLWESVSVVVRVRRIIENESECGVWIRGSE